MAKRVLADFDLFAHTCPYFYNGAPVNNGYGCRHPECGEDEEDDAGQPCGCCHRYTCPICCPFGEEDLDDPELDLDGRGRQELFDRDGGFADGGSSSPLHQAMKRVKRNAPRCLPITATFTAMTRNGWKSTPGRSHSLRRDKTKRRVIV